MNTIKTLTVNGKQYALIDDQARQQLAQESARVDHLADACPIVCEAHGQAISVADSAEYPIRSLRLFGKTVQSETPAPEKPVALKVAGASGSVLVNVLGKNLFSGFAKGTGVSLYTGLEEQNANAAVTGYIPVAFGNGLSMYLSGLTSDLLSCVYAYDAEKVPVGRTDANARSELLLNEESFANVPFVSEREIAFVRISVEVDASVSGTLDLVDALTPQLEFGEAASNYEAPKTAQLLTIPTPGGLPGIPVIRNGNYTDDNGGLWVCDEVDLARGVYVQRVNTVTLQGSSSEIWNTGDNNIYIKIPDMISLVKMNALCTQYTYASSKGPNQLSAGQMTQGGTRTNLCFGNPGNALSKNEWLARLAASPITVQYILADPVEMPLSEETLAVYSSLRTSKPAATIVNNSGVGMEMDYVADTKTYIDNAIAKAIGG